MNIIILMEALGKRTMKSEAEVKVCLGQISFVTHAHMYQSPVELQSFLKYNPGVVSVKMQCF